MRKIKIILQILYIIAILIMIFKLGFSTHYWRMIDSNILNKNFDGYFLIDRNYDDFYDIFKYKYIPFLEFGTITLFFIPFLIIYFKIKESNSKFFNTDFILFRFDFINAYYLGIRRLLSLLLIPLTLIVLLTPLIVSGIILYFFIVKNYEEYNEPQIFGLMWLYGSFFSIIAIYSILGILTWIVNGFISTK